MLPLAIYLEREELARSLSQWLWDDIRNQQNLGTKAGQLLFAALPPSSNLNWDLAIQLGDDIATESGKPRDRLPVAVAHYRVGNHSPGLGWGFPIR